MEQSSTTRRQLLTYGTAAGATVLAGCIGGGAGNGGGTGNSGGTGANTSSSEWVRSQSQVSNVKKITWLNLGSMDGDPASAEHADVYENMTNIKAKPRTVPPSNALSKSRTLLQGQSVRPDIYQLGDTWWFDLAEKGFFERLDAHVNTFDAWIPGAKKAAKLPLEIPAYDDFTYPKGIYATPWYSEGWITFTNKDVLEEAGLSRDFTASSYSEFRNACEELKNVVDTPVLFPFSNSSEGLQVFQDLVLRAGGHFYDGTTPDFMNDGFIKALDFLLNLVYDGYAPNGITSLSEGSTTSQFFSGKAGFQFNALGNLFLPGKSLPIDKPSEKVARIQLYPTPDNKGYQETPTGYLTTIGANLSVFSKRKAEAAKFMNLISTREEQARELLMEGNLPLRTDVFDLKRVREKVPYNETMREQLAGYDKLIYPNSSQVDSIVYQEITSALSSGRSAKNTAQRIQKQAEQI